MIKLQELTPSVYYEQSRDFQFIGRLYDIVLNYVKTNADNLYTLPIGKNMDEKLLNLLAFTLGFQSKHHYNSKQLLAICSVLPLILKHKGSLNAILIAVNSILYAEGISQALDYEFKNNNLVLYLSQDLSDFMLDDLTLRFVQTKKVTVANRANLDAIKTEMNFQLSGEVSTDSIQQLGAMLL